MTLKQIEAQRIKANLVFETAKKIRETLDAARKEYGPRDWDDNDRETEILDWTAIREHPMPTGPTVDFRACSRELRSSCF